MPAIDHKRDLIDVISDQSNTALLAHKPVLFIGEEGGGGCLLFGAMVVLNGLRSG